MTKIQKENKLIHYKTKNNKKVIISNKFLKHIEYGHNNVLENIEEAINNTNFNTPFIKEIYDFGKVVGKSEVIETSHVGVTEITTFAKRKKRGILSRVVEGECIDCTTMVIIAKEVEEGVYTIVTAYIGVLAEKEYNQHKLSREEKEESYSFWKNHAFVYDENNFGIIEKCSFA